MDLSTTYLGLKLPHPLMPGSSPLVDKIDTVKRLEDAGAAAIVMHSLFEEQIVAEQLQKDRAIDMHEYSFAEALSYFPKAAEYRLSSDEYLEHLGKVKKAVGVPVIASLNGTTGGGWLAYAKSMEEAGADALELNVYAVPADQDRSAADVEKDTVAMVRDVKKSVKIPVGVKLSPFYSSPAHFAKQLEEAGADGLILFNRFYQPDLDVEKLEVKRTLSVSDPSELLLRLRWLAILSGRLKCSLGVTGGVHTGLDAVKAVMCGANAVQVVSALLSHGADRLKKMRDELASWMQKHDYKSLEQMRGSMNLYKSPNPTAFERANYQYILQIWRGEAPRDYR
ncbi:MAG: dihydroorotate dehydrogenase-like protein [Planctomycetota bacterium]|jgi:dihydroorotate dehydrogenase (fumarate)